MSQPPNLAALQRLGPRALAAAVRRLVLPLELWMGGGAYGPFVAAFSRACDAAEPWYALGHDARHAPRLQLEGVEMRGSREERQVWSMLWSASHVMESCRTGDLPAARNQFLHTIEIVRDWSGEELADASRLLLQQASDYVAQIAKGGLDDDDDPPIDGDGLVIPAFYHRGPAAPPGGADAGEERASSQPSAATFDAVVDELARLLRSGDVAVFCGAGISIASGMPSAHELRTELLRRLPASEREVEWLARCDLPFEAFLEPMLGQVDPAPLWRLFAEGRPSGAHCFLADLASRGMVRTIATTNFDELVERALAAKEVPHDVVWRLRDLEESPNDDSGTRVLKLHGTVSDPPSLAAVMEQVAGRRHLPAREKTIASLFARGSHRAVLVLGYSCSDHFDITPAIASLGDTVKRVYLVQHADAGWLAEDIRAEPIKNPFRACPQGTRLVCNTDLILQRLWRGIADGEGVTWSKVCGAGRWQAHVDRWWNHVPEGERVLVGNSILAQLWYSCADYRAAKAHARAALAAASPPAIRSGLDLGLGFLPVRRRTVPPAQRCQALLRLGGCHRALSEYREAMRRFQEAARVARLCGDNEAEARASGSIGTVLFNTGDLAEAAQFHERSAAIWRDLDDRPRELGSCLANLGNVYGAMRRLDEAHECFREGLDLAREIGDKTAEGSRLGGLGQVQLLRGEWPKAEASHRAALEIAMTVGDRTGMAHQYGGLASVKEAWGRLDEAIADGLRAIELFEELGDRQGAARILGNLGSCFLRAMRIEAAIECLLRSLEMSSAIGDATVLGNAVNNLQNIIDSAAAGGTPSWQIERATRLLRTYQSARGADIRELERAFDRLLDAR